MSLCLGAYAQGEQSSIQLSGIVVDGDSSYGVPGVHIYVPRAGRGAVSNHVGFFSLRTMIGDTVIVRAVGYKQQKLVVPQRDDLGFTVLIDLKTDTTFLPVVEVFPYPTKELFKEAFLALKLPDKRYENMEKNLNPEMLRYMVMNTGMDAGSNFRYFMDRQVNYAANRNFSPSYSFLNPFAWAEFIRSVKRGDLKRKDKK